ncbi:MAG TPA: histidine kinase [Agriterribacter sp.]|nr:histidine kinase [Agriterribacter sp.]
MQLKKLESWGAVVILLVYVLVKAYESISSSPEVLLHRYGQAAIRYHLIFDYYKYYLIPQLTVVVLVSSIFFTLNFKILPSLLKKSSYYSVAGTLFISFVVVFLIMLICNTWLQYQLYAIYDTRKDADMQIAKESFAQALLIFALFIAYYLCKMLVMWLYTQQWCSDPAKRKTLTEVVVIGWSWLMLLSTALICTPIFSKGLPYFVLVFFPLYIALFFALTRFFIPWYIEAGKRKKLIFTYILINLVVGFPLFIVFAQLSDGHRNGLTLFVAALFHIVMVFITWFLSRYYIDQQKGKAKEIRSLRQTISQKTADIDFLRSQINPHFLFNALNTIYGTALQEHADRTAEGVQKLGDMMRFMLQENQQEKIPLSKEINYLTNYIDLQRLRTHSSPDIAIDLTIKDKDCRQYIAPMLLIPFVENAFKHGISLKEKSWIKINISCDTENLYFDVYNSVHLQKEDDPEKNDSGIGLENVKQRLSLLYPGQHELHIRSTNSEYFIHLTIKL